MYPTIILIILSHFCTLHKFPNTFDFVFLCLQTQNPQLDLPQRIKQDLPISKIRNALNKYNAAFSEDTQRGTDRLIRNVIQVKIA